MQLSGAHTIVVPPEKDPLPRHSGLHAAARLLGALGFVGYAAVIAAILSDHPGLWDDAAFVWFAVAGLASFLLGWRNEGVGGALLIVSMLLDQFSIPATLLGWRYVAQAFTLLLMVVGFLLLLASRNKQ